MIVTIKKDNDIKKVTKGAYENFYKDAGYTIEKNVKEEKPKSVEVKKVVDVEPKVATKAEEPKIEESKKEDKK